MKWLLAFADFCTFPFFFLVSVIFRLRTPPPAPRPPTFFLRAFTKKEDAHVHTQVRGVIRSADGGARWWRGGAQV